MPGAARGPAEAPANILVDRAHLFAEIRAFMAENDFLEVDTPVLCATASSERALDCIPAGARYLVPSPEHAMKRLLAAGSGPIYQLGHVFRAGETGRWHNPEFTMLEWYGVEEGMAEAIDWLAALLTRLGAPPLAARSTFREVFSLYVGEDPLTADSHTLAARARDLGVAPESAPRDADRVFWLDLFMAICVQPKLGRDGPEIVTHFPADDAVLIASDPEDTRQALRFECYWSGVELANGASESTDPVQARRAMVREQAVRAAQGRDVPPLDEALLAAMASGLPPCAGVALGVDRLLALLRGEDAIGSVLHFPV